MNYMHVLGYYIAVSYHNLLHSDRMIGCGSLEEIKVLNLR